MDILYPRITLCEVSTGFKFDLLYSSLILTDLKSNDIIIKYISYCRNDTNKLIHPELFGIAHFPQQV